MHQNGKGRTPRCAWFWFSRGRLVFVAGTPHAPAVPKRRTNWLIGALLLAALLLGVRAMLPIWVADYLNGRLANIGDYRGHLQSVDLALWRGAYRIHELEIEKRDARVGEYVPFLDAPETEIELSWRALASGSLVGRVEFHAPELNFVDSPSGEDQVGEGVDWREQLQALLPVRLNEVLVSDGAVHFRNFQSSPKVDVYLRDLQASARNLSNAERRSGEQVASFDMEATALDGAPLEAGARFDPLGEMRDFEFDLRATGVALPQLNDFLRAYGNIDAEAGNADVVIELAADEGRLDGYVKLLLREVEVVNWQGDVEDDRDNPLELAWESVVGGVMALFTNPPRDQFAFRAPIRGELGEAGVQALPTVASAVRNAFFEALRANFEGGASGEGEQARAAAPPVRARRG